MSLNTIIVVNTAPGCNNSISQQISTTTCNTYIVRITPSTNALGPFNVYLDTISPATILYSAQTRTQMLNGVTVQLGPCVTPTPTPTPSVTPTSATPTPTPTPSITPSETPTNTPTPSQTGTPGLSPTPTQTPTNTETPTQTPTNTETPTSTPTPTPSFTPTETPTNTPTPTETPTPGASPTPTSTQTPTPTETPTSTPTPTPTPTESIIILEVLLENGFPLLLQDGSPLLQQQLGVPFLVSGGDVACPSSPVSLTQTIYGLGTSWVDNIVRFYTDITMTTPFNGGGLYYTDDAAGCGSCYIIDSGGYATFTGNPC